MIWVKNHIYIIFAFIFLYNRVNFKYQSYKIQIKLDNKIFVISWSRDLDSVSIVTWSRYRVILCFQPNYLFCSSYKAIAYSTILWCQTYLRINLQSRSWRWLGGEASPLLKATGLLEAQRCNEDGNGLGLRATSRRPRTYSDIRARSTTRWTQWDRLSVGETSASNLLTTM